VTASVPAPLSEVPIAAITRASIKPRHVRAFWRLSPPAEASLAQAEGCLLAAGLGEAPLLRQCTFSLWRNTEAMDAYARSGAHQQAIRAAYGGGYFSESMFVRFVPLLLQGSWQGRPHG
jgi:spheroidene monooxygenase